MPLPLKIHRTISPPDAKIAIVGECAGEQEELSSLPFQGASGQELRRILADAGINLSSCFQTNVFPFRPRGGKVESLFAPKAEVGGKDYHHPPLSAGKYLRPEYFPWLEKLKEDLLAAKPNIVIALGATATWALLGTGKISSVRGTVAESSLIPGLKVIPTFHPAMVFRQWASRPIVVVDCMKALRESAFSEIRRRPREVWIEPTIGDIEAFFQDKIFSRQWDPSQPLAFDIETKKSSIITCIGFGPSPDAVLVIPFYDSRQPDGAYWRTLAEEVAAWKLIKSVLTDPKIPKLGQNGLYDIQYLWKGAGIPVVNYAHDTMILHHAKYLELPKGLGFQGSIYCNEASWKTLRAKVETANNKRDE